MKNYRHKYYNLKYKIMKIDTKKKHRVIILLIVLSSILLVVIGILEVINFHVIPKKKAEETKKEYNLALQLFEEENYDDAKVLFMDNFEYGYSGVYLKYIEEHMRLDIIQMELD